ncbi:PLP-dependent cysteine synthase family protein [Nocardia huaxiensis]|uniref:PLP-dependent cysteine synthase family protein n=1 Tax=Nocardia huaxiensis TaxID=2755382 RepID=A0A7D6V7I7_9NOCA|nr:PLP-dependent cysteine synthase family protein [Nocardia huaxiensis]QLY28073.1 PLP-dependent cysteine synthase family protein [Nocardia huaxiensis]UFS98491.1 PLP-dependent cysteine synthase family protein [Nocardia huaxiensis]
MRHIGSPAETGLLSLIGDTPLAWIPVDADGTGFWAKLESAGVGGMKARAAVSLLAGAAARGELAPGAPVVESTSGTLGMGLALAARALGHPVILVVDDELEPDMRALFTAYGIRLEVVERAHPTGGWQQARLDRLADVLATTPGAYWPDQYNNPDNAAGYADMAREILAQADRIDVLVATVGSGGHCAGLTRELRRHWPDLRVIGVDSVGSRIFGQPARQRIMRGLGSSILPRNVAYPDYDEVHWVGPVEAVASCRAVAARTCLAGGWSTGAAALVAGWVARTEPGAQVLTVFPDGPHRYLRTIYDDEWCTARGLLGTAAAAPIELATPDESEVSGWARCRVVRDPAGTRVSL